MSKALPHLTRRACFVAAASAAFLAGCKPQAKPAPKIECSSMALAGRETFLLIDRTCRYPKPLVDMLIASLDQLLTPGDLVSFESFGGDQPNSVPERHRLAGGSNRWRDSPRDKQAARWCESSSRKALADGLRQKLSEFNPRGPSPVFEALLMAAMRPVELLILVSNGLQHSTALSFLARDGLTLRLPTPKALLSSLTKHGLLPNRLPPCVQVGLGLPEQGDNRQRTPSPNELIQLDAAYRTYHSAVQTPRFAIGLPWPANGLASTSAPRLS